MRKNYETVLTDEQWEEKPAFTLHSFYRRARLSGLWYDILEHMVKVSRQKAGKEENPRIADSQSVKNAGKSEQCGY